MMMVLMVSIEQIIIEKKRFVLEGSWTRFLPIMDTARELIASGAIGDVRVVRADFGLKYVIAFFTPPNQS
jgi:predicted dehydrogenase